MQSDEREGRDCVVRGYETVLKAYCSKKVWMKFSRKSHKASMITRSFMAFNRETWSGVGSDRAGRLKPIPAGSHFERIWNAKTQTPNYTLQTLYYTLHSLFHPFQHKTVILFATDSFPKYHVWGLSEQPPVVLPWRLPRGPLYQRSQAVPLERRCGTEEFGNPSCLIQWDRKWRQKRWISWICPSRWRADLRAP